MVSEKHSISVGDLVHLRETEPYSKNYNMYTQPNVQIMYIIAVAISADFTSRDTHRAMKAMRLPTSDCLCDTGSARQGSMRRRSRSKARRRPMDASGAVVGNQKHPSRFERGIGYTREDLC